MGGLAGGQSVRPEGLFASSAGTEATHPQPFPSPSQAGSQTGGRAGGEAALKAPRSNLGGEQALWSPAGATLGPRGRGGGRQRREKGVVGTSQGSPWSRREPAGEYEGLCAPCVWGGVGWGALVYFKVSSTLKKINKCQSRVTIRLSTERYTIDPLLPALSLYLWDSVSNPIQR